MSLKLYSEKDLDHITTLSRVTRWRLRRAGKFPKPIHISNGRIGYVAEDIDHWISEKRNSPDSNNSSSDKVASGEKTHHHIVLRTS